MESLAVRRATHRGIVAVVGGASSGSADTVGSVTTSVMPLLDTAADDRDGDWPGQATDAKFDGAAGLKASCRVVDGERLRTATGVPRCA